MAVSAVVPFVPTRMLHTGVAVDAAVLVIPNRQRMIVPTRTPWNWIVPEETMPVAPVIAPAAEMLMVDDLRKFVNPLPNAMPLIVPAPAVLAKLMPLIVLPALV